MTNNTIRLVQANIKKYRHERGYSQEELSEIAGISRDYLSEIERTKKIPSLKRLLQIAEALEVPAFKFFQYNLSGFNKIIWFQYIQH